MVDENPVPSAARPDTTGQPPVQGTTPEDISRMRMRLKEEATKQAISNVLEDVERKMERKKNEREIYGEKIQDIEAVGEPDYNVGHEPGFTEKFKAEVGRIKRGPMAYKTIAQIAENARRSKHKKLAFAGGLAKLGVVKGVKGVYRGLENTGQDLISPVEKSPVVSTWYEVKGAWYRRDMYTVTSKTPLNTRRTEMWQAIYQVEGPGGNKVIGIKEPWHKVSVFEKRINVNEKRELYRNMQGTLNGADIVREFSAPKSLLRRSSSINVASVFGGGGYPLSNNLRNASPTVTIRPTRRTARARAGTPVRIPTGTMPQKPVTPQIRRVTFRPPIAAQSVAATMGATAQNAMNAAPQEYTPEYASAGMGYRSQVRRWVGGRPKVIGFIPPMHTPLAQDLIGIQDYARELNYTGPPTLTRNAAYTLAGIKHAPGPSHDIVNQIFDPRYAMAQIGGGARPTVMSYQGRPMGMTVNRKAFKPTVSQRALTPQFANLQNKRQTTGNIRWF
jgi:hypothetical protein